MTDIWRGLAVIASGGPPGGLLGGHYHRLTLEAPEVARRTRPGQFVHILCPPLGPYALAPQGPAQALHSPVPTPGLPFLRRPFSVHDADPVSGTIDLLFRVKGSGTRALALLGPGARLDVVGPLGRGFPEPGGGRPVVVGGGIGLAPLLFLARTLACGDPVTVLAGVAGGDDLALIDPFRGLPGRVDLAVAAEDGAPGTARGQVTVLLGDWLRRNPGTARGRSGVTPVIYACGPRPMLAAVWHLAAEAGARAWVSLEERMACAVGVCRGCAVAVRPAAAAREAAPSAYRLVCRDGPVFDAAEIDWGEAEAAGAPDRGEEPGP